MAFQLARCTRTVVLTVPVWPESGFGSCHPAAVMSYTAGAAPAAWTRHPRRRRTSESIYHYVTAVRQEHSSTRPAPETAFRAGSLEPGRGGPGTRVDPATRSTRIG